MTERECPIEPVLSGAASAVFDVAAYCFASLLGACLGAWSAGWDLYSQACIEFLFGSSLGLRKPLGLLCFFGLGMLTLIYYQFDSARWELLNGWLCSGRPTCTWPWAREKPVPTPKP